MKIISRKINPSKANGPNTHHYFLNHISNKDFDWLVEDFTTLLTFSRRLLKSAVEWSLNQSQKPKM